MNCGSSLGHSSLEFLGFHLCQPLDVVIQLTPPLHLCAGLISDVGLRSASVALLHRLMAWCFSLVLCVSPPQLVSSFICKEVFLFSIAGESLCEVCAYIS